MTQANTNIKKVIKSVLSSKGFNSYGSAFIKGKEKLATAIQIQKPRYNSEGKDFTLNWGIYLEDFERFYDNKIPNKVSFKDCTITGRVSTLAHKNYETWWPYNCNEDQLSEVESLLNDYAIPFLDKINTIEDIIDLLEASRTNTLFHGFHIDHPNPEPFQAILYCFLGRVDTSYKILDDIIFSTKSDLYAENMNLLKKKIKKFYEAKIKP